MAMLLRPFAFGVPVARVLRAYLRGSWPLAVLFVLYRLKVRLGQPHLFYRWSELVPLRFWSAVVGITIGLIGLHALHRAWSGGGARRAWGAAAGAAYGLLVLWTFVGVPQHVRYHVFNLLSPSHEGAFTIEAQHAGSIRGYVTDMFFRRLALEPEVVGGRRVLSNPPGMTVAAVLAHRLVVASPGLYEWLRGRYRDLAEMDDPEQASWFASSLVLAIAMTFVWGASIFFGYRLGRLWFPPAAALAIAFACTFNPATMNFTPGKDPVQMASVLAMLWLWMAGHVQRRPWFAAASGVVLCISLMMGLIHLWVFAIAAAATLWEAARGGGGIRSWMLRRAAPAASGAAATSGLLYVTLGWNVPLIVYRVGVRYGEVQQGVIADPFYLTLLGLPLFLLFVGPMFYMVAGWAKDRVRDAPATLGYRLLMCMLAVLAYTYFTANNNETPRLWMPFIPLLLIPLAVRRPDFRMDSPERRGTFLMLMAMQLVVTLLHWSLMDARETEYRIFTTQKMFD